MSFGRLKDIQDNFINYHLKYAGRNIYYYYTERSVQGQLLSRDIHA
jgi:hypothetical protein